MSVVYVSGRFYYFCCWFCLWYFFIFSFFFDFPKKFLIKSKRGGTGGCDGGHSKWPRADLGQGRRLQRNGMGCQLLCCHAPLRDLWFVVAVPTTTTTRTATKTSWETTQGFICNLHANRVGPVYKKQVLSRLLREKCVGGSTTASQLRFIVAQQLQQQRGGGEGEEGGGGSIDVAESSLNCCQFNGKLNTNATGKWPESDILSLV